MKVEVSKTRSGDYTAKVYYDDELLQRETSLYLCSKINPIKEAEGWAKANYSEEAEKFLVYGMGLGYHVKALIELCNEKQEVYIIETNQALWSRLEAYNCLMDFLPKKYFLVSDDLNKLSHFMENVNGDKAKLCIHTPSLKLIPNKLSQLKEIFYYFNICRNDKRWSAQIKENYAHNHTLNVSNVKTLYGTMKDKPLIIVSSGPSLDKNIDLLKDVGEQTCIFTGCRNLRMMQQKGIRTDFACMIDAGFEQTYKQIEGIDTKKVPLIFLDSANYQTVAAYEGEKYMAYSISSNEHHEGEIDPGGSVANTMLELAIQFGANPIIFIGQDLAYTNNQTHSIGAGGAQIQFGREAKKVKGVNEDYVMTSPDFLSYKYWIEQRIRKTERVTFINATEGGAYIEGCKHMTLKKALQYCDK